MRRWLISVIVVPLCVLLCLVLTLLVVNGDTCAEEGMVQFGLVMERLPEDTLYADLVAEGKRLVEADLLSRTPGSLTDQESGVLLSQNMAVLDAVDMLLAQPGNFGPERSAETAGRRRSTPLRTPPGDTTLPPIELRRLKLLMLHKAALAVRHQDHDDLLRYLRDLSQLAHFEIQSPDLIVLMSTIPGNQEWFVFMLNEVPVKMVRPELEALMPNLETYREAMIHAMYATYLNLEVNMVDMMGGGTERLIMDRCKTSRMISDHFKARWTVLQGPWELQPQHPETREGTAGMVDLLFRGGATDALLSDSMPMYDIFKQKLSIAVVMSDAVRLRLLLALEGGAQNGDTVTRLVKTHGLKDPYTNFFYSVTKGGRLKPGVLLDPVSADMRNALRPFARFVAVPK